MTDLTSAALPPVGGDDHVRGRAGAPLVVLYADFTCVRCAVVGLRLARMPVRVAYRHLVLSARGPRGAALGAAAEAAARQGAFWALHDRLFADQGHQDDPHLWAWCTNAGLDLERFDRDRRDAAVRARISDQTRSALRAGATATPTLVDPSGALHCGAVEPALAALKA